MSPISFKTKLISINAWTILRLSREVSDKLPSRGQVMVEGTINGYPIQTPLEPDGNWGHWFRVDTSLQQKIKATAGDTVSLTITPVKVWPEPIIPDYLKRALDTHPESYAVWQQATPMAHWEWIRWIRATNRQETRDHRVEVGMSKLKSGERRPCCWNRNLCSEPVVSKNGVLLEPSPVA
jgi:hypothetical protein